MRIILSYAWVEKHFFSFPEFLFVKVVITPLPNITQRIIYLFISLFGLNLSMSLLSMIIKLWKTWLKNKYFRLLKYRVDYKCEYITITEMINDDVTIKLPKSWQNSVYLSKSLVKIIDAHTR